MPLTWKVVLGGGRGEGGAGVEEGRSISMEGGSGSEVAERERLVVRESEKLLRLLRSHCLRSFPFIRGGA